ncbi:ABC transporter [Kitasatospora sp. MMS16-BH015]|uniref:ABC transporter permease n=1 Tax=Kitasatospora sp. MMS16-BH015 TaxID=2018025 RepID=UPI000CA39756|nr:ABC transporter permease [Kitasatospora sp. MMS16-BH015]AUG81143.1 ABC transporter [Kitasatospora sp. MMS16-BH015]
MTTETPTGPATAGAEGPATAGAEGPAAVLAAAPAPRGRWRQDAIATLYREYFLLTRNRTNLLLAVTPSAVYLLLFATSLSHLIGQVHYRGRNFGYAEFTVPALLLSAMLSAATTAGTSLFQEKLGQMELELWSYPLRRSSYVFAKLAAGTALVLAQTLAALVVALLVFDFRWPAAHWAALLCGTLLASFACNGLYLLLATLFTDFQRFTVTINVLAPVLLFAAPSFYPADRMAPVLRALSWADPVTYLVGCLRDSALLGFGAAWPEMVVLAVLAVASSGLIARSLLAWAARL